LPTDSAAEETGFVLVTTEVEKEASSADSELDSSDDDPELDLEDLEDFNNFQSHP
jgi:hypothetical protein